MKKQLLAIAVSAAAAAPMAAMAEPEVYGRFDVTLQKSESISFDGHQTAPSGVSTDTSGIDVLNGQIAGRYNNNGTGLDSNVGDQWEVRNNKSRLGVRGDAELSTSLNAIYQLEMQFQPTTTGGPGFTNRNTFVGLEGDSWGQFFVGAYDSIIKQAEFSVDQFNNTDADIENVLATQQRYSNTLNYASPKIGPGIQVKAQVQPGESRIYQDDGDPDRQTSIADSYGLSIGMEEGNMYGAIAYETAFMQFTGSPGTNPANTTDIDTLRVSGGLDGDQFGVGFLWEQMDGDKLEDVFGQDNDDSRDGWVLSGRFNPTTDLAVKLQHGVSDEYVLTSSSTIAPISGNNSQFDERELVQSTIGVDYMLGKQTKLYTFYSMQEADGKIGSNANNQEEDDSEFNVLAFGMQHRF